MFERGKKDSPDAGRDDFGAQDSQGGWSASERREPAMPAGSAAKGVAVIGSSIRINGDLEGEEDLLIEGVVNGTVRLKDNTVTIGREGKIKADVYAKAVNVDGNVEGDLYGAEQISVRQSAQVEGNIVSPRVSLEDGARFKGSIEMDPDAVKSAVGGSTETKRAKPKSTNGKSAVQPTALASAQSASSGDAASTAQAAKS